jgi:hypothetical protein
MTNTERTTMEVTQVARTAAGNVADAAGWHEKAKMIRQGRCDDQPMVQEIIKALTTAQTETAALRAEVEALREANSILEAALIETREEFPNSAAERWIDERLELARAALTALGADAHLPEGWNALRALEDWLVKHGMKPTVFGRRYFNDPRFVSDLRNGRRLNELNQRKVRQITRKPPVEGWPCQTG